MPIFPEPNPMSVEYSQYGSPTAKTHPLTDLSFLDKGMEWPPMQSRKRLYTYEQNRLLWKGLHDRVFDSNWLIVMDEEKRSSFEIVLNWHKRLTTLWADLMLTETPRFMDGTEQDEPEDKDSADNSAPKSSEGSTDPSKKPESKPPASTTQKSPAKADNPLEAVPEPPPIVTEPDPEALKRQQAIDRITAKDQNGYVTTLYEIALDVSRFGDGIAKITLDNKEGAEIWACPPGFWFPVVRPDNLRKFEAHVLAHTIRKGDFDYLFCEIHERGKITRRVHKLEGNIIGPEQPLNVFTPLPPVENTQVDGFLVVPFHGLRTSDEIFGMDDYQDIDSIICAIELRCAQINKILSKHSDPSMYGPPGQLETDPNTGETVFKSGGRYFEVDSENGEDPPGYVVWEAQMDAQFAELDFLLKQLYIVSETTPAAFGHMEQGLVESGSALRRLMQAPLAKTARIAMRFDPAAKEALKTACDLEHIHGYADTPEIQAIQIQWQDGVPPDPLEQAQVEQIRTGGTAATSSLVSSIRRLDGGTREDAEAELERIEAENQRRAKEQMDQMVVENHLAIEQAKATGGDQPPQANGAPSSSGKAPKAKKESR